MGPAEALTAGLQGERPHLLSWVFGEPLNHILQFPERDGWGQSHSQGSGLGGTGEGAEGRGAGRMRKLLDGPGRVWQENFPKEPSPPPRMHGTDKGWKEGWPWGMTSGQRTFAPEEGNEGVAQILTW